MAAVAESVGDSMGGSSGALYQIFFLALAGMQLSLPECQHLAVLSETSQQSHKCSVCLSRDRKKEDAEDRWGALLHLLVHLVLAALIKGQAY